MAFSKLVKYLAITAVVFGLAFIYFNYNNQLPQASAATFTRNLTVGDKGTDVTELQKFLVSKGFLVIPKGVAYGSFGQLTKTALAKYQTSQKISPAVGFFGALTRAKVGSTTVAAPTSTPTTSSPTTAVTFTRNLTLGDKGTDVVELQKFLVSKGLLIVPPSVPYGEYGPLTKAAVTKFQASQGLPPVGEFGPLTRTRTNTVITTTDYKPPATPTPTPPTTSTTPTSGSGSNTTIKLPTTTPPPTIRPSTSSGGGGGSSTSATTTNTNTTPQSTKFQIGDRIESSSDVNVRNIAGTNSNVIATQPAGTLGSVFRGSTYVDGLFWWNINYDIGADGWTAEDFILKYIEPVLSLSNTSSDSSLSSGSTASQLAALTVAPNTATLTAGESQKFTANGWTAGASTPSSTPVTWTATGGTIDQNGNFTAGNTPGTYTVRAQSALVNWRIAEAGVAISANTQLAESNSVSESVSANTESINVSENQSSTISSVTSAMPNKPAHLATIADYDGGGLGQGVVWIDSQITQQQDASAPKSPSTVRRYSLVPASAGQSRTGAIEVDPPSITEVYIARWLKPSPDLFGTPSGSKSLFIKGGGASFYINYMNGLDGNGGAVYMRPINQGLCSNIPNDWMNPNRPGPGMPLGQWSLSEVYFKLNTPGVADGILKIWTNGQLTHEFMNMNCRASGTTITEITSDFYQNLTPANNSLWWWDMDHFYVSGNTGGTVIPAPIVVSPPTSTKFITNDRVQTFSTALNVRASASATGTLLGTQSNGSIGTIIGGPTYADGLHWWNINYDTGADGWSAEDYLTKYTAPGTVNVVVNAINTGGGTATPSSFTVTASGANANPASFTGSRAVTVTPNSTYAISVSTVPNYTATLSSNCSGTVASGATNTCTITETYVVPTPSWIFCANEDQQCSFTGTKEVRYGINTSFAYIVVANGIMCSNAVFGDPAYGFGKQCHYRDTTALPSILAPTVSISASPTSITSGQSGTISWSSTNATSCTASNGWSGTKGTSGTQSVSPTSNTTYTLTCAGAGGSANQSVTVSVSTVVVPPPIPPPSGNNPLPVSGSTILVDTRAGGAHSIQNVNTLDEATLKYRSASSNSSGFGHGFAFTNNMDGAGKRAFRCDYPAATIAADAACVSHLYLNQLAPRPKAIYVQWKHLQGRTATGGGLGALGAFDNTSENDVASNAGRKYMLLCRPTLLDPGGCGPRVDHVWAGPAPASVKSEGFYGLPHGSVSSVEKTRCSFDPDQYIGQVITFTHYFQAESAPGARDGVIRFWYNGQLCGEQLGLALSTEGVDRIQWPETFRSPEFDMSEYFWDVLMWTPPSSSGSVQPIINEDFSRYTSTAHLNSDPFGVFGSNNGTPVHDVQPQFMFLDQAGGVGGGAAMRYDFADRTNETALFPGAPQLGQLRCTDSGISRKIMIPGNEKKIWVELYAKYSTNWTVIAPVEWGCTSNPDYKFVFGGVDGIANPIPPDNGWGRFQLDTHPGKWIAAYPGCMCEMSIIPPQPGPAPGYYITQAPMPYQIWDGQFHKYRFEFKLSTTTTSPDGGIREWIDDVLLVDEQNVVINRPRFWAVILGANMNQGPGQAQSLWWDSIKVWNQNPGW